MKSISSTLVTSRLKEDHTKVIQAYGKVLEEDAPAFGTVADTSKLPYPKKCIKESIIAGLITRSDQDLREHLKTGYISLATWQDGVGETNKGVDIRSINVDQDGHELAKRILEAHEASKEWNKLVSGERDALKKELQDLGFW